MAHPGQTNYPIIRTTSNVDGTTIQVMLNTLIGRPYEVQNNISQDGFAICIDDSSGLDNWDDHKLEQPRLAEYEFSSGDVPSYLSVGSENTTHEEAKTIVSTQGASGDAWGPMA